VGEYKLIARRVDGPTFDGTFSVQTYEIPKALLAFDLAEPVVQRGEPIKGALVLKYAYGEPVVGKTVEYSLLRFGERIARVGVTDPQGLLRPRWSVWRLNTTRARRRLRQRGPRCWSHLRHTVSRLRSSGADGCGMSARHVALAFG
jgi:hypothetical protein